MESVSDVMPKAPSRAFEAILWGGLLAGTLDIIAAMVNGLLRGGNPGRLLRAIASGVLGAEALSGGAATAALGLLLHFVIAFGAAAVYYAASRKVDFLVRQPLVCGALYGIAVYAVMNSVIVPLSAAPFPMPYTLTGVLIHIFCVGLPIALAVRWRAGRG